MTQPISADQPLSTRIERVGDSWRAYVDSTWFRYFVDVGEVDLTEDVVGILPVANGGTGSSTYTPFTTQQFYRYLAGFEPDKLDTTHLNINPGSCVDANGLSIGSASALFTINLGVIGVNGMDAGPAPPADNTGCYVYLIKNNATSAIAAVVSSSIIYSGVVVPAGYTLHRKLPFGFIYRAAWDGIPDFHLTHWPMPFIRLTGSELTATWQPLAAGAAAVFTDVNLTNYMPDNARQVYIYADVAPGGAAGSAYMRVLGSQATGVAVGASSPVDGLNAAFAFSQRVTSTRRVQYRVTGGATLSLYVLGYDMTEPV